jgi:hypothetical protein
MKQRPLNKRQQEFLVGLRERFIHERVSGYRDKAGNKVEPVDLKTAERLYAKKLPDFRKCVFDPDVIAKFCLDANEPIPAKWRKLAGPPLKKKPAQKEHDPVVRRGIVIKLTKAEAEDILHVLEKSLDRQDIGPDYAERCGRIINKISRASKI